MQWQRVEASWWSSSIIIRPLLLCSSICIAWQLAAMWRKKEMLTSSWHR
jgi:hypothetical protein